jgi:hypothetical protein
LVGIYSSAQIHVVLLDLLVDTVKCLGGRDLFGGVDSRGIVNLLDSEAASKGTGDGVVAAANGADVSSGGSYAVEIGGHLNVDGEVFGFGLGEAVYTRDVVSDG